MHRLVRHGAHPDIVDFPILRGLYNLVFVIGTRS
jgi:hypothetical protein